MKGVPIKFRGRDILSDKYYYGDFVTRDGDCAIRFKYQANWFSSMHEYEIAVKPDSVDQLVGYDANGAEVYEGDKLIDEDGKTVEMLEWDFTNCFKTFHVIKKENDND